MDLTEIIQAFTNAAVDAYFSGQCLPMWMP